ncbi:hypothetical protein DN069_19145 [Streptacidiphilus pinicola]|uniref:Uncharacterized protein n=1 Tax=Streptacidiphilus pinicola TaxID=2219663 RepID=A0A2X0IKZ6_9ACTN|nr:hypothetical protein DN069_19145 [Streptacidiphilus pinicola]
MLNPIGLRITLAPARRRPPGTWPWRVPREVQGEPGRVRILGTTAHPTARIFPKLGIKTRAQLRDALSQDRP